MTSTVEMRLGLPVMRLDTADALCRWFEAEPRTSPGMWLVLTKKGAGLIGLSKAEAVDAALCHGWIDGQQHPYDAALWLTRFTPRRRSSRWSQVNRHRAQELVATGRMTLAGLAEIQAAQADGRWDAAYAPASTAQPSPELQAALDASPQAATAFAALGRAERYAILHQISNLKTPQGRTRRILQLVGMLEQAHG